MEARLTDEDKQLLKSIYAPQVVGLQPEDSRCGICVMPDGELRHYGVDPVVGPDGVRVWKRCYLSSVDCGLSWKFHYVASESCMGSVVKMPWSDRYITLISDSCGCTALLSDIGPDDPAPRRVKISDKKHSDFFQPKFMKSRRRIGITMHLIEDDNYSPVFVYSDDSGESWTAVELKSAPKFVPFWPSVDPRWENNGGEPIFTELPDGRLLILARTSLDYLYAYYSDDGGETWTDGEPSNFHCTLTTPYFLEMTDGRTLLFWNNTQPLPEIRHDNELPPHPEGYKFDGEDVFTNRDVSHCAYTVDGVNWKGFRELYLNEIRNEPDFRTHCRRFTSNDKSVHQFQAIELPYGKVLVAVGQNESSRRMLIFDPNWLSETDRSEDFLFGLARISTHMYVKSISGHVDEHGHCSWNRTNGALLVPDPGIDGREVLQLCRIRDPRLFSEKQGAVWNFPMAKSGEITIELMRRGSGIKVALCDHWFNPIDVTAGELSPFHFDLTEDTLRPERWYKVSIRFDTASGIAVVTANADLLFYVRMRVAPDHGISYLHLQTAAESFDPDGTYIRNLKFTASEQHIAVQ